MIIRPRLDRAVALAASFLAEHQITQLPVDPQAIIRQCGWSTKSYSSVVKNSPDIDTVDELIAELNSPDAATLFSNTKIAILYNDTVAIPERIRFSLCHEIGHLILEHFTDFDVDNLSEYAKAALETEANVFAANLMSPVGVLMLLQHPEREQHRHIFGMSRQAWQMRLKTMQADIAGVDEATIRQQQAQFHAFMYTRVCDWCGHEFISADSGTCPLCQSNLLHWKHSARSPIKVTCTKTTMAPAKPTPPLLPLPSAPQKTFPWTAESWSAYTFSCMWQADLVRKKPWKDQPALYAEIMTENPMVIDELWKSPTTRRKTNGKRRSSSPYR